MRITMATRWSILSAGKISNTFVSALRSQDPNEHKVIAIAARSKEKAQAFANEHGITTAYGSYEELVKNPDIDIVYIGSIHPEHHKLSMLCLNAGKNVLCEKPVTMTLAAAKEIFSLAKEKKLFFMEGVITRSFPAAEQIRREIEEGCLGDILMMDARFCVNIYHVDRLHEKSLGGGGLLDIGCYPIMLADMVFKERPEKITVEGQLDKNGVDTGAVIILRFSENRLATIMYNTKTEIRNNTATIMGTKGSIQINHHCFCPSSMTTPTGTFEFSFPDLKFGGKHLQYEISCVRECLQKGLLECPLMTHASSENTMYIMETALKQMGVTYDFPYTV